MQRRRRHTGGTASVSFESERASYQALLDRLHHHSTPSISFDNADQNSCAASLAIDTAADGGDRAPSAATVPAGSTTSRSTAAKMTSFLTKLGNTFSRSASAEARRSPHADEEENRQFVSNFFYTEDDGRDVGAANGHGLRLDIDPEHNARDPYFIPGCGPGDLLSACESATSFADRVLDLLGVGGDGRPRGAGADQRDAPAAGPVPDRRWMKGWQSSKSLHPAETEGSRRRLFTPPKLSARHAEGGDDGAFCAGVAESVAESVGPNGGECDGGGTACPEAGRTCPELSCSPE